MINSQSITDTHNFNSLHLNSIYKLVGDLSAYDFHAAIFWGKRKEEVIYNIKTVRECDFVDRNAHFTNKITGNEDVHIVCAEAIRNCNAVVVKNTQTKQTTMYHVSPMMTCNSSFMPCEYDLSSRLLWEKQHCRIANFRAAHVPDLFTKNQTQYKSYEVHIPFELKFRDDVMTSDRSESERFHVFVDFFTEESLIMNKLGERKIVKQIFN